MSGSSGGDARPLVSVPRAAYHAILEIGRENAAGGLSALEDRSLVQAMQSRDADPTSSGLSGGRGPEKGKRSAGDERRPSRVASVPERDVKRTLLRNTVANTVTIFWGLAFALVLPPFVIRTLGKESYGIWVLVSSFSVLSGYLSVLDLGLQATIVKFVAEYLARNDNDALNRLVSNALTAYLILGAVASGALVVFARFFLGIFQIPPHLIATTQGLFYILAIQVFFEFVGLAFAGVLEGLQRFDLLRWIDIARLFIYAPLVFWFLSQGFGVTALAFLTAVTMIGRVFIVARIANRVLPSLRSRLSLDLPVMRQIFHFTSQIFIIRMNSVIYNQMDKAIIGAVLISTLLTDYDIANKIHQLVLTSLTLVSAVIMPMASDLHARQNLPGLQRLFLRVTKYSAALCLPTTVAVMVLARYLIQYWIGPEYAYNDEITRLFLVYLIFTAVIPTGQNIMIGMDCFGPILPVLVLTTAINLVVSVVMASYIGVAGVILGTIVGAALAWYPYMRHFLSTLSLSWNDLIREVFLRTYPQAALCALVMVAAVNVHGPANLVEVAVMAMSGFLFYMCLFYLSGLENAERELFYTIVTQRIRGILG